MASIDQLLSFQLTATNLQQLALAVIGSVFKSAHQYLVHVLMKIDTSASDNSIFFTGSVIEF